MLKIQPIGHQPNELLRPSGARSGHRGYPHVIRPCLKVVVPLGLVLVLVRKEVTLRSDLNEASSLTWFFLFFIYNVDHKPFARYKHTMEVIQ